MSGTQSVLTGTIINLAVLQDWKLLVWTLDREFKPLSIVEAVRILILADLFALVAQLDAFIDGFPDLLLIEGSCFAPDTGSRDRARLEIWAGDYRRTGVIIYSHGKYLS